MVSELVTRKDATNSDWPVPVIVYSRGARPPRRESGFPFRHFTNFFSARRSNVVNTEPNDCSRPAAFDKVA